MPVPTPTPLPQPPPSGDLAALAARVAALEAKLAQPLTLRLG